MGARLGLIGRVNMAAEPPFTDYHKQGGAGMLKGYAEAGIYRFQTLLLERESNCAIVEDRI